MKPTVTPSSHEQEFPYGWRYVRRGDEFEQVPLTLEDVLHPQEDDVIPVNFPHDRDCRYLAGEFESCLLSPPLGLVTHDLLVNWGVPGIGNHSPDVAVFVGLSRPLGREETLDLRSLGGRCLLVVEVVSPSTRNNDVIHKFDHYYRVGIPLYIIIDQEDEDGPRWVHAYRHTPAGYVEVPPDGQGRVALPPLGLLLGMREDRAVCFDAAIGEELSDHAGLRQECRQVREQALQQREEADQAMSEQVDARQAAERREIERRQEAERSAKEAQLARQETELARKEIDLARQETELARKATELVRQEVELVSKEAELARKATELARQEVELISREAQRERASANQRIHELEETLRRLQAAGTADATNPPT